MANEGNLKPFKKGNDPRRNLEGRPKKYVTILKAQGYKISEINDTITSLLAMTMQELKAVPDDPEATMLEVIIARALWKDASEGSLRSMETILSRVFGHPKTSFENTITEQPLFPDTKYDNIEDADHEEIK